MRVLVTGANGFLGRAVVAAATAAGHDVGALVRPLADVARLDWPTSVTVVRGDLRQRAGWIDHLADVDAVIHLAAAATGDLAEQFAGTVVATENLLGCLVLDSLARFVHVSSFSVYDFTALPTGAVLDERTPIEPFPERRDAYTATKLAQEELVRTTCANAGVPTVIIRPGAIFGPGKEWAAGSALRAGPFAVVLAPRSTFRLTYVDNCARAIVRALDVGVAPGTTVNIVDDDLPTHAQYFRMCRDAGAKPGRYLPVPWTIVTLAGRVIQFANDRFWGGRAKVPELLSHRRQQARWKPLAYSNATAKRSLGWSPAVPMHAAVQRTFGS